MAFTRFKDFFKYHIIAFFTFILIFNITLIIFFQIRGRGEYRQEEVFELRTELAVSAIERRINDNIQILRGAQGFYIASDSIERDSWRDYVSTLELHKNYPGIQGVGLTLFIRPEDLEEHVQKVRREGFKGYEIVPEGPREIYTAIIYLEPFDWRNQRALGFDMFSEPVRRAAMETAMDTGEPSVSDIVVLVQETEEAVQPGFLIYLPVYKKFDLLDVAERRSSIEGFVYSPFRAGDLLHSILGEDYQDIEMKIFAGTDINNASLLYRSDSTSRLFELNGYGKKSEIMLPGNQWTILFAPKPDFYEPAEYDLAYAILFGGTAISLLIFSLMYFMSNARKAQEDASERIKENSKLLNDVFYKVPALVGIIKASDMRYILVNSFYGQCFGANLLGKNIRESHEEMYDGFFDEIERTIKTGQPFFGKEVSFKIARGEGSCYEGYFNLVFQPLVNEKGQVDDLLIFAVEVTEMVRSRSELALINDELSKKNAQLIKINNDLDNFIYTASHDLKAPISNIEGLINELKTDSQFQDDEILMLIEMMVTSVERFKQTIQDLTEISKSQRNIEGDFEKVNFLELIGEISIQITDVIKKSHAEIITDIKAPEINFSKKNIRSIMYNLLSNSIKYRHPERTPKVFIHTYYEGSYIVLVVKDNGLGVEKDKVERMFTMFSRLHDHVEGTGVGLYIVKRIIDNTGGKIEVDSVPGEGITFKIYFLQ